MPMVSAIPTTYISTTLEEWGRTMRTRVPLEMENTANRGMQIEGIRDGARRVGVGGVVRKCRTSSHHGRDGMEWDGRQDEGDLIK